MNPGILHRGAVVVGIGLTLLVWGMLAASNEFAGSIPGPMPTLARVVSLFTSDQLAKDVAQTVLRWMGGLFPAVLLGSLIGIAIGSSISMFRMFAPTIDFFRSIPVTAAFPAFLLLFGVGDLSISAMGFAATLFIVILHAANGARSVPKTRLQMAHAFGATRSQTLLRITMYEALPYILIGGRTALSLALVVTIVSEMLVGSGLGVGQKIFLSYQLNQLTDMYALILVAGLIGYAGNLFWMLIQEELVPWKASQ